MSSESINTSEFIQRLLAIEAEQKRQHDARHETNARLIEVLDAERLARMDLEETVTNVAKSVNDLASTVKDLVSALSGGQFGQAGLVAQISALQTTVTQMQKEARDYRESLDAKMNEGRGMLRLAAWTGAALGVFATARSFLRGV